MPIETTCPSCEHLVTTPAAEPVSCAECGQWFVPADADRDDAARLGPHELEVQRSPGDAIRGPFDRIDLRERLYLGLFTGDELVRPIGGRFATMRSHPDFAAILRLKERGRPGPVMVRRAPLKPAAPPVQAAADAVSGEGLPPDSLRAAAKAEVERTDPKRATRIALATLIIGGLVIAVAYVAVSLSM